MHLTTLKLHWTFFVAAALLILVIVVAPIALPDAWPFAILISALAFIAYVLVFEAVAGRTEP